MLAITLSVQSLPRKLTLYTSLSHRGRMWYTSQHCQRGNFHAVFRLTYLLSTLSRSVKNDDEVNSRIAKASSAFGRLRDRVQKKRGSWLATKRKVNTAALPSSLLHACEIWPIYERHIQEVKTNFTITASESSWRSPWVKTSLALRSSSSHAYHTHSALKNPGSVGLSSWHNGIHSFPKNIFLMQIS